MPHGDRIDDVERLRNPWPDHRAERTLGAVSLLVCACVVAMIVFVGVRAWPIFEHNGLSWLGPGGSLETQIANMQATSVNPPASAYHLRAWPLVYGTLLSTGIAVVLGVVDRGAVVDLHRRAGAGAAAQAGDPGDPTARVGAVGDLRADRRARARAVRRQPPDHRLAEDLGAELRRAHRRRAGGRRRDPDGDDHADHDRADLRGADGRAGVLARGGGRARAEPAAGGARGDAARDPSRRSSPRPCSRPRARSARR